MKMKEYQKVLENYYNLSNIIGMKTVKEMEKYLFDFSTGKKEILNPAQVAQITKEREKQLKDLEVQAIDEAFTLIVK